MKRHSNNHELRAVIFALEIGRDAEFAVSGAAFMMPLVDKSVIQHVIESVVRCDVTHIDVVVASDTDAVHAIINKHLSWGIRIEVHCPADVQRPYAMLRRFAAGCTSATGRLLLVHADRVCPGLPVGQFDNSSGPLVFMHNDDWTGTALLMQKDVVANYRLNTERNLLGDALVSHAKLSGKTVRIPEPISLTSGQEFLAIAMPHSKW